MARTGTCYGPFGHFERPDRLFSSRRTACDRSPRQNLLGLLALWPEMGGLGCPEASFPFPSIRYSTAPGAPRVEDRPHAAHVVRCPLCEHAQRTIRPSWSPCRLI